MMADITTGSGDTTGLPCRALGESRWRMFFKRKKKTLTEEQKVLVEWLEQVWLPTHGSYPNRRDPHYEESRRSAAAYMSGDHYLSLRIASHSAG